MSEMNCFK